MVTILKVKFENFGTRSNPKLVLHFTIFSEHGLGLVEVFLVFLQNSVSHFSPLPI
jgi:hypothetical protein